MTVCWASRREEASAVVTTTQRSAAQVASGKPRAQARRCVQQTEVKSSAGPPAADCHLDLRSPGDPGDAPARSAGKGRGILGCSTAASSREQRLWATSEKSIRVRSDRPRARSRFRRPMSQSRHSTRRPDQGQSRAYARRKGGLSGAALSGCDGNALSWRRHQAALPFNCSQMYYKGFFLIFANILGYFSGVFFTFSTTISRWRTSVPGMA